ncbi:hypothetical protein U1Q18_025656 [Sarracenia purpurea var. burkii]
MEEIGSETEVEDESRPGEGRDSNMVVAKAEASEFVAIDNKGDILGCPSFEGPIIDKTLFSAGEDESKDGVSFHRGSEELVTEDDEEEPDPGENGEEASIVNKGTVGEGEYEDDKNVNSDDEGLGGSELEEVLGLASSVLSISEKKN